MSEIFNSTLLVVATGSCLLGILCGTVGSFAVLKRESLVGDMISHAALPGIVAGFMLFSRNPLALLAGAATSGLVSLVLHRLILRYSKIKEDASLALILSVFFGFGLVLLTYVQKRPDAAQAGLTKFTFGQAATLLREDVIWQAGLFAVAMLILLVAWKEWKILTFDSGFARSVGLPVRGLEWLRLILVTLTIAVGLQIAGVVLVSALLVAPAVAARQWTNQLSILVIIAGAIGGFCGTAGAYVSSAWDGIPTGPAIVLFLSAVVIISLVAAPRRGLLARGLLRRTHRDTFRTTAVLLNMYDLESQHSGGGTVAHSVKSLQVMPGTSRMHSIDLVDLVEEGHLEKLDDGRYALTEKGRQEIRHLTASPRSDA